MNRPRPRRVLGATRLALFLTAALPLTGAAAATADTQTAYDAFNASNKCAYIAGETILTVNYPSIVGGGSAARVGNPAPHITDADNCTP